jgi:hypothetical protein
MRQKLFQKVQSETTFADFLRQPGIKEFILNNYPQELGEKNKGVLQQSVFAPLGFQALLQIIFRQVYQVSDEEALWHSFRIAQEFPIVLKDFKTIVSYDVRKEQLTWRY